MSEDERREEFQRIWDAMPGRSIDKVRRIADVLCCKPITVRIYAVKNTRRVIPERCLMLLRREFRL